MLNASPLLQVSTLCGLFLSFAGCMPPPMSAPATKPADPKPVAVRAEEEEPAGGPIRRVVVEEEATAAPADRHTPVLLQPGKSVLFSDIKVTFRSFSFRASAPDELVLIFDFVNTSKTKIHQIPSIYFNGFGDEHGNSYRYITQRQPNFHKELFPGDGGSFEIVTTRLVKAAKHLTGKGSVTACTNNWDTKVDLVLPGR